jgi:hypothetical protein
MTKKTADIIVNSVSLCLFLVTGIVFGNQKDPLINLLSVAIFLSTVSIGFIYLFKRSAIKFFSLCLLLHILGICVGKYLYLMIF